MKRVSDLQSPVRYNNMWIIPSSFQEAVSLGMAQRYIPAECEDRPLFVYTCNRISRGFLPLMFSRVAGNACFMAHVFGSCYGFNQTRFGVCTQGLPDTKLAPVHTKEWYRQTIEKYLLLYTLLQQDSIMRVVYSDIDTVIMSDILLDIKQRDAGKIWFAADWRKCYGCKCTLNGGFFSLSRQHMSFLEQVYNQSKSLKQQEQDVANRMVHAYKSCVLPLARYIGHKWAAWMYNIGTRPPRNAIGYVYPDSDRIAMPLLLCNTSHYHITSVFSHSQKKRVMKRILAFCDRLGRT